MSPREQIELLNSIESTIEMIEELVCQTQDYLDDNNSAQQELGMIRYEEIERLRELIAKVAEEFELRAKRRWK